MTEEELEEMLERVPRSHPRFVEGVLSDAEEFCDLSIGIAQKGHRELSSLRMGPEHRELSRLSPA